MATYVLVPAAWCGSWSWKFVVPALREAGHAVYPLSLTGMGDRVHLAHPDIGLGTHVDDVVKALEFEDLTEVVLVGWSYGSMVVTAASHRVPERIGRVVILDARLIPTDGQSVYDISPDLRDEDAPALRAGNGWQIPPPSDADFQPAIPDDALRQWFVNRLAPMPVKTQSEPARLGNPAAERIPHTLIRCSETSTWSEEERTRWTDHLQSEHGWEILDLHGNHIAPVAQPRETAAVLMRVGSSEAQRETGARESLDRSRAQTIPMAN